MPSGAHEAGDVRSGFPSEAHPSAAPSSEAHSSKAKLPETGEVPTLPLPSRWRLVAAAVVTLAFLAFLYHSYEEAPEPLAPAGTGHAVGRD